MDMTTNEFNKAIEMGEIHKVIITCALCLGTRTNFAMQKINDIVNVCRPCNEKHFGLNPKYPYEVVGRYMAGTSFFAEGC